MPDQPAALAVVAGGAVRVVAGAAAHADASPTDGGDPRQRARFMAMLGLTSSALFALTIVGGRHPALGARCLPVASPCCLIVYGAGAGARLAQRRLRPRHPADRSARLRVRLDRARRRAVAAARRAGARRWLAAHMVQHELLMVVAAPLIAVERAADRAALGAAGAASPARPRRRCAGRRSRRLWAASPRPRRCSSSTRSRCGSGICRRCTTTRSSTKASTSCSISASSARRRCSGGASRTAATAAPAMARRSSTSSPPRVHGGVLGALLTLSPRVWYAPYLTHHPSGLTPLEDQQLAGLLMWVPAGLIFAARRPRPVRRLAARIRSPHALQAGRSAASTTP